MNIKILQSFLISDFFAANKIDETKYTEWQRVHKRRLKQLRELESRELIDELTTAIYLLEILSEKTEILDGFRLQIAKFKSSYIKKSSFMSNKTRVYKTSTAKQPFPKNVRTLMVEEMKGDIRISSETLTKRVLERYKADGIKLPNYDVDSQGRTRLSAKIANDLTILRKMISHSLIDLLSD